MPVLMRWDDELLRWVPVATGPAGERGVRGPQGPSAYDIAVAGGYTGTQEQWLASLVGPKGDQGDQGPSAYDIAVAGGYTGTLEQWLASLVGPPGPPVALGSITEAMLDVNVRAHLDRLPDTSTDNTIPLFDGTQGKLQTSPVTISDDGQIGGGYVAGIGNLLTMPQALCTNPAHKAPIANIGWSRKSISGSTSGWSIVSTEVDTTRLIDGLPTMRVWREDGNAIGTGGTYPSTADQRFPVTPQQTITAVAAVLARNAGPAQFFVRIGWYDANGTYLSASAGASAAATETAPARVSVTAQVPDGAVTAAIQPLSSTTTAPDVEVWVGGVGVWVGAGGRWACPGVPIPDLAPIRADGSYDMSGPGSPEGVVAARVGCTWTQTDSPTALGGILVWRKRAGGGSTGWTVVEGESTLIRPTLLNGWGHYATGIGGIVRHASLVTIGFYIDGGTSDTIWTLPPGYTASPRVLTGTWQVVSGAESGLSGPARLDSSQNIILRGAANKRYIFVSLGAYRTADTWPAALPAAVTGAGWAEGTVEW